MIDRIKMQLAPPVFENEEKTRVAGLLNTMLITIILATVGASSILAL